MTHEFDGKKYEAASTHQREWGAKLIEELSLRGNEHILDLGCGDGALTVQLADLVPGGTVIGIDASQGMIQTASQKHRDNLSFILMDINQLDFTDRFNVIFSNAALHWVHDHQRLLNAAKRALRDSGRLRFNFAGDGNCATFFTVVRDVMKQEPFCGYFRSFEWPWYMPQVEDYQKQVDQLGFAEARVWSETADRYFPDSESMIRWIDQPSLVPFMACISHAEDRALFREEVITGMLKETKQPDGRCFETFRRINLFAKKQNESGRTQSRL